MIYLDRPRNVIFRNRRMMSAHLFSDLHGAAGHAELLAFTLKINSKPRWLQHIGEPHEHLDLLGRARIAAAREAGAVEVSPRTFVMVVRTKRATLN